MTTLTTDTFTESDHPAWRVAGPNGIVTYRSLRNELRLEPLGADPILSATIHADQVRLAAATGNDEDVLLLLAGWYHRLSELGGPPDPWPDPPGEGELLYAWQESIESNRDVTLAERQAFDRARHDHDRRRQAADDYETSEHPEVAYWRSMAGDDLIGAMLTATWYPQVDDLIGGWCVTVVDAPPSTGAPEVASFIGEDVARHIADLHNQKLRTDAARAESGERSRALAAQHDDLRTKIQIGDVVRVPAGVDLCVTTTHRFVVEKISSYGLSGPRINANGAPIKSRSAAGTRPDGNLEGLAEWPIVQRSTVTRDDQVIHTPEGEQ